MTTLETTHPRFAGRDERPVARFADSRDRSGDAVPRLLGPEPRDRPAALVEPPTTGFLQLSAVVGGTVGRTPFPRRGRDRATLLWRLRALAAELEALSAVERATVYDAVLVPPVPAAAARHIARYDVVVLVETTSLDAAAALQSGGALTPLTDLLAESARELRIVRSRCVRRIADVDKTRPGGLFLFNYFAAEDPAVALATWERAAAWYAAETGLENSTLLAPEQDDDYVFVNHARWDESLPRFAWRQFSRPSFRSYLLPLLRANRVQPMPILYRIAGKRGRSR